MDNQNIFLIGIIVLVIIGVVFYVFEKNAQKKAIKEQEKDEENKDNEKVFSKKDVPRIDITKFMEFDKISDDMIIQKGGSVYTMVVQCKGINYDLMSEIEQSAVEEGFITFLNTLRFPIQIYVQARAIDLRSSMQIYNEKIEEIEHTCHNYERDLNKMIQEGVTSNRDIYETQLEYKKYSNMLSYAQDITRYVERMSTNRQMLQRKFYIVFSYNKSEITNLDKFSPQEVTQICYTELYTRAQSIIGALQACSVNGTVLNSNMLAELLYISYNRDDEKIIDIKQALSSGFYRLFSVTKDVDEKKDEVLSKEYQKESSKRIQDLIKYGISKGSIPKAAEEAAMQDEKVDKMAMKYVAEADIDLETKDVLSKMIIKKHLDRNERKQKMQQAQAQIQNQQVPPKQVVEQPSVKNQIPQQQVQQNTQTTVQRVQPQPQPQIQQQPVTKPIQPSQVVMQNIQSNSQQNVSTQNQAPVTRPMQQNNVAPSQVDRKSVV